jgi:hypothetical protein
VELLVEPSFSLKMIGWRRRVDGLCGTIVSVGLIE